MKKWIATILSISLVVSMAAVFNACGKKPKPETDTTAAETTLEESAAEENTEDATNDTWDDIFAGYEDLSVTEKTTNEHYQEEYDALTLPVAVTQQKVEGTTVLQTTTNPAVRETTTQFMFTSPSHASTTAKDSANKTTAAANGASTAAPATTAATTTTAASRGTVSGASSGGSSSGSSSGGSSSGGSSGGSATYEEVTNEMQDVPPENLVNYAEGMKSPIPSETPSTPQVTYLEKYVKKYLDTGVYTVKMDVKGDGMEVPLTIYSDTNNLEFNTSMIAMAAQANEDTAKYADMFKNIGKMRYIIKNKKSSNPKAMIAVTGAYVELDNGGELASLFNGADSEFGDEGFSLGKFTGLLQRNMQYRGTTTANGLVCETYTTDEGMNGKPAQFNFYFTNTGTYQGIVNWTIIDLETNKTVQDVNMRVYNSVTSPLAFTPVGVKMTEAQFKEKYGFDLDEMA